MQKPQDEFRVELINRFFNSRSYFYRCLNRELEQGLQGTNRLSSEAGLLLGNLFDKLVSSTQKIELLDSLAEVEGFAGFLETLNTGVQFLRNAPLTPEQLEKEIDQLAQSVFDAAANGLEKEETRRQLSRLLNGASHAPRDASEGEPTAQPAPPVPESEPAGGPPEEGETKLERPPSPEEERVTTQEQTKAEQPQDFALEVDKEVEPFSDETDVHDSDLDLESSAPLSNVANEEEKDVLRNGNGTDSDDGGCDYEFSEENGSTDSVFRPTANLGPEPGALHRTFQQDAEMRLRRLGELLDSLERNPDNSVKWRACHTTVEEIATAAMIYGFEPFEQTALKTQTLIAQVRKDPKSYALAGLPRLRKVQRTLTDVLRQDPDQVDDHVVKELLAELKEPLPRKPHRTVSSEPKRESAPDPTPQEQAEAPVAEFRLPGEDDEEILRLVGEIAQSAGPEGHEPKPPKSERAAPQDQKSDANELKDFKQKARLYFEVIEEALRKLRENPEEQIALQDLELAARSLNSLTLKLSLEPLSSVPAALEAFARRLGNEETGPTPEELRIVEDLYRRFVALEHVQEVESAGFKKLLVSLQELNRANGILQ